MASQSEAFEFDRAEQARFRAAFESAARASVGDGSPMLCLDLYVDWVASPVGPLVIGATRDALCMLEFSASGQLESQMQRLRSRYAHVAYTPAPILIDATTQLSEYFAGTRREFRLPLHYPGSVFQERVWAALLRIPYGETCSYGDIAHELGDAKAMRAVGTANGLNPIAIVIPCHRVVNANGNLGGYGGGLWRKQILLDLERGQARMW